MQILQGQHFYQNINSQKYTSRPFANQLLTKTSREEETLGFAFSSSNEISYIKLNHDFKQADSMPLKLFPGLPTFRVTLNDTVFLIYLGFLRFKKSHSGSLWKQFLTDTRQNKLFKSINTGLVHFFNFFPLHIINDCTMITYFIF